MKCIFAMNMGLRKQLKWGGKMLHRYRERRNREELKRTFMHLWRYNSLKEISIMELAQKSSIARSTFYTYYSNIYELIDEIAEDMFLEIKTEIEKEIEKQQEQETVNDDWGCAVSPVFHYIDRHQDFFKKYFQEGYDYKFKNKLEIMLDNVFGQKTENEEVFRVQLVEAFLLEGSIGILRKRVMEENSEDLEKEVMFAKEIIRQSRKSIIQ